MKVQFLIHIKDQQLKHYFQIINGVFQFKSKAMMIVKNLFCPHMNFVYKWSVFLILVMVLTISISFGAKTPVTKFIEGDDPVPVTNWLVAGPFVSLPITQSESGNKGARSGYTVDFLQTVGGGVQCQH